VNQGCRWFVVNGLNTQYKNEQKILTKQNKTIVGLWRLVACYSDHQA